MIQAKTSKGEAGLPNGVCCREKLMRGEKSLRAWNASSRVCATEFLFLNVFWRVCSVLITRWIHLDVRFNAGNTPPTPVPWNTSIIRKNNVMNTYANIGYARVRNVGPFCVS